MSALFRRYSTLNEMLLERSAREPKADAALHVDRQGVAEATSFAELLDRAGALAAEITERAPPGARVLLLAHDSRSFLIGFFGAVLANAVVVPLSAQRLARNAERLGGIASDCDASLVLTSPSLVHQRSAAETRSDAAARLYAIPWLSVATPSDERFHEFSLPRPSDPAMLQYTSGTTGTSKGVIVTHANLIAHAELVAARFGYGPDARFASWLPLNHDMGLIGCLLTPLLSGIRGSVLISPLEFAQRPERWLRMISTHGITVSGGPDSAYDLCCKKIDPASLEGEVDLSSWETAFCGSEPVRAATLARFAERFAALGFRYRSFFPCYGLAEATLMVSGGNPRAEPRVFDLDRARLSDAGRCEPGTGLRLVGCGFSLDGQEIRIVDPVRRIACEPGEVGEVWVRGPCVSPGYWGHPCCVGFGTPLGDDDRSYLRTGDLGAMLEGELVITGRIKELLIIRGRNFSPEEVEAVARGEDDSIAAIAAMMDRDGSESIELAVEVWPRCPEEVLDRIARRARSQLASTLSLKLSRLSFLRVGDIPRTSSGKLRRAQLARDLELGTASALRVVLASDAARSSSSEAGRV